MGCEVADGGIMDVMDFLDLGNLQNPAYGPDFFSIFGVKSFSF